MSDRVEFIVYLLGVMLSGVFYSPAKAYFASGMWFALAAIGYLVALRAIGMLLKWTFIR
jgi:hypothetical protein